ncbi:hypothetical protein E2C01_069809 [Portunus trituberculatus]|uniref:Uncharacterized protein n=1 Tax=Portunus trituberculatus TaxID=210409 RepID=A0A5B7HVJ4_PORTR|nr:hypothetical protein [Portunus trituberculatus]
MRTGGGPPPVQKPEETPSSVTLELIGEELQSLVNDFDCDGPESAHQEISNGNPVGTVVLQFPPPPCNSPTPPPSNRPVPSFQATPPVSGLETSQETPAHLRQIIPQQLNRPTRGCVPFLSRTSAMKK